MKTPYTKTWNPLADPHAPLDWRKPQLVEVHVTDDVALDDLFPVMALASQHTFAVGTENHPRRLADYLADPDTGRRIYRQVSRWLDHEDGDPLSEGAAWTRAHKTTEWRSEGATDAQWNLPLPNVIPAAIIRTQADAYERLPYLLRCPAVLRAVCLRLREGVDLSRWLPGERWYFAQCPTCGYAGSSEFFDEDRGYDDAEVLCPKCYERHIEESPCGIHLVTLQGEIGRGAHPMHPDCVRSIRDQCKAASVPFWFSGWGEWMPIYDYERNEPRWNGVPEVGHDDMSRWVNSAGEDGFRGDRRWFMRRTGPSKSGHTLDGRTHHELPEALAAFATAAGV